MASRTPIALTLASGVNSWTNQPAAQTEFLGLTHYRVKADLSDMDKVRLSARIVTAGVAGAVLGVQYSTDESTWLPLTSGASLASIGTAVSTWLDIPAGAKGDVFLRLGGQGGDAVADPAIGLVVLEMYGIPTFERLGLVDQILSNVYGLIRNMRDNATGYKAQVTANVALATIAAVMVADANQYLLRIQWITDAFARSSVLMNAALGDMGLTTAQAVALRDTLQSVANHTKSATLTTGAQVNTEADFILANVPNYERLW